MIYIVSGVAKSGKTLVSKEITKRYHIPYFSTDYLMMMLFQGNKDLNIDIHASDSTVSKQLEPYLLGLITTMIQNKVDYLLEGVHFNPDFGSMLIKKFPDDITIIYLGYQFTSSIDKFNELIKYQDSIENKWYSHYDKAEMQNLLDYLISESKRIASSCLEYNLRYIEVKDMGEQLDSIIDQVMIKRQSNQL